MRFSADEALAALEDGYRRWIRGITALGADNLAEIALLRDLWANGLRSAIGGTSTR